MPALNLRSEVNMNVRVCPAVYCIFQLRRGGDERWDTACAVNSQSSGEGVR